MRDSALPMDEADRAQLKKLAEFYPVNLILMELSEILFLSAISVLESPESESSEKNLAYKKKEQSKLLKHTIAAGI